MPKGYVIAHISVNEPEAFRAYVENNGDAIARYNGRVLVKGGASEVKEGEAYDVHIVVEFPSFEDARTFYNDPVYQEVAQFRKASGESIVILVEGNTEG